MNRFFRSALFPLIIIVVLVYLASQTLLPGRSGARKLTYSQLITEVRNGAVNDVAITPDGTAYLTDSIRAVVYRVTRSQLATGGGVLPQE